MSVRYQRESVYGLVLESIFTIWNLWFAIHDMIFLVLSSSANCEAALRFVNANNLLPLFLALIRPSPEAFDVTVAAGITLFSSPQILTCQTAQCLHTVTEDNPSALEQLSRCGIFSLLTRLYKFSRSQGDLLTHLAAIMQLERSDADAVILKVAIAGYNSIA